MMWNKLFAFVCSTTIATTTFAVDCISYASKIDIDNTVCVDAIKYATNSISANVVLNPVYYIHTVSVPEWCDFLTNIATYRKLDTVFSNVYVVGSTCGLLESKSETNSIVLLDVCDLLTMYSISNLLCRNIESIEFVKSAENFKTNNVSGIELVATNSCANVLSTMRLDYILSNSVFVIMNDASMETLAKSISLTPTVGVSEIPECGWKMLILNQLSNCNKQYICLSNQLAELKSIESLMFMTRTNMLCKLSDVYCSSNALRVAIPELYNIEKIKEVDGVWFVSFAEISKILEIVKQYESRFDLLSPHIMSSLGAIKEKAKKMETNGENTDKLWNLYWDLFLKGSMQSEDDDL